MALALEAHIIAKYCADWEKEIRLDVFAKQIDALNPSDYEAVCYAVANVFRRRDYWHSPQEYDHPERVESMRDHMDGLLSDTLH